MNLFVSVIPKKKESIEKYKRILKRVIPSTIPFSDLEHDQVIWNNHSILSASFSIHQTSVAIKKYTTTTESMFCTFNGIPILNEFHTSNEPWSSILLDKYTNGELDLESIGGYFNLMIVDSDCVRVCNSLVRTEPVYWVENKDCTVVGNRASLVYAIANQSTNFQYDTDALISLCTIGWPVHDLVPFKDVYLLPSGTMMEIRPGKIKTYAYKPYEFNEIPFGEHSSKQLNQLYDELCEVLLSGVKLFKNFKDSLTINLTGGKDSRLAAALCSEAGLNYSCITSGGPEDRDVIVASEVAKILGVDHKTSDPKTVTSIPEVDILDMIKRQVIQSDGCSNVYDPCYPIRLKPNVQFVGHGGACYKGGYDNLKGSRRSLIKNHRDARIFLDNLSLHNKGILLTDDAIHQQEKINDEIIDRFFSSSFPNENFYDFIFTVYREGRAITHNRQASAYGAFQYSPNYNDNALRLAWKVPLKLRQNHSLYYNLLLRLNPQLANHRFSDSRWKFEENGPGPNTSYDEWKRREPLPPSPKKHQVKSWRYGYDNEKMRDTIKEFLLSNKNNDLFQIIDHSKLRKLLLKSGPTSLGVIRSVFGVMSASFLINNDWVDQKKYTKPKPVRFLRRLFNWDLP